MTTKATIDIKTYLKAAKEKPTTHKVEAFFHSAYFGFVTIEAKELPALAAGCFSCITAVLAIYTIVMLFIPEAEGGE